ncbi:MFS transporter [Streptomyces sp. SID4912]|nr:MFS transporter [Streptomyces sp. SID4941]MYY19956.1 MFS transporter [Streptomyces sp. SID4912]SCD31827.1 drug resistance transporter, EmrB/QacA subfamily [Streptomyces sp. PalvLS-984]SCD41884.1 drug resistance transporter, EmrB/QacA subfamily [Streptomyces sp. DpondAA-D4]SDC88371.1 drug resistance transporter, EmrB/QacA subfamily [Streptomyces sp. AmelKG-A3]
MSQSPPSAVPHRGATIVMACLGVFVAYLPVTSVSVSLTAIQQALSTTTSELAWVSDAFVLPMAAFILTAGVFGDVHGRRKVFVAGLLLSAAGAATSLTAHSIGQLWTGQALSGLGAAALLPTTLALISHAVPDHRERGKFIGIWAMCLLGSLAVGGVLAGTILSHADWRWIFLVPLPVALVAVVISLRALPESRAPRAGRLDWPGQITAALAIIALVYGVIEGGAGSFGDTQVVVALAVAVVSGVLFVMTERRSAHPMLDLTLFRSPGFTATTLVAMIMFLGMIGFFFVLSLYFGMVQRLDTLGTAWRLLVITGAALIVSGIAGRVMHRLSPRLMITTGLLMVTAALLTLLGADAGTSFGSLSWRLLLLGLGMGLVTTPMTATAVASVPHPLAGMAAAGNNAFRQVGGALGPAVLGALLTSRAVSSLPGHLSDAGVDGALADQVTAATRDGGLGAVGSMALGPGAGQVWGAVGDAFLEGMRLCLIVSAGLTFLAAVLAFVLLHPRLGRERTVSVAGDSATRVPGGTERRAVETGTPA